MKQKIYLVKKYMRFHDDETPTREMRKRASVLWAVSTKQEAADDVIKAREQDNIIERRWYKEYYFIQEVDLYKALSND